MLYPVLFLLTNGCFRKAEVVRDSVLIPGGRRVHEVSGGDVGDLRHDVALEKLGDE